VRITPSNPELATLSLETFHGELRIMDQIHFDGAGHALLRFSFVSPFLRDPEFPDGYRDVATVQFSYSPDPLARPSLSVKEANFAWGGTQPGKYYARSSPTPWAQPPPECLNSESTPSGRTAFSDAGEALSAVVGRWAVCQTQDPQLTGVEIFPNGTWNTIQGTGALRFGAGFEQQGTASVDASDYGFPGDFWLRLTEAHGFWYPIATDIQFSASGAGFGGLDFNHLVRLEREVSPPLPPTFDVNERGGSAACASAEAGIEQPFASTEAELQASLAGDWIGCSGYLRQLRFDGRGSVEFSETESHAADTESYQIVEALGTAATLRVGTATWRVVRSTQPVKLWVRREGGTPNYDPEVMVFSGL
jgi:hypothetical protein